MEAQVPAIVNNSDFETYVTETFRPQAPLDSSGKKRKGGGTIVVVKYEEREGVVTRGEAWSPARASVHHMLKIRFFDGFLSVFNIFKQV